MLATRQTMLTCQDGLKQRCARVWVWAVADPGGSGGHVPLSHRWQPRNIMRINSKRIQLQQGRLLRRYLQNANKPALLSYCLQMKKKSQEIFHHLGTQKMKNYA